LCAISLATGTWENEVQNNFKVSGMILPNCRGSSFFSHGNLPLVWNSVGSGEVWLSRVGPKYQGDLPIETHHVLFFTNKMALALFVEKKPA